MLSDLWKQTLADGGDGAALAARTMEILEASGQAARLEGEPDPLRGGCGLTAAVTFPVLDGPRFQTAVRLEHPSLFTPDGIRRRAAESARRRRSWRPSRFCTLVWTPAARPAGKRGVPSCLRWSSGDRPHRFLASASTSPSRGWRAAGGTGSVEPHECAGDALPGSSPSRVKLFLDAGGGRGFQRGAHQRLGRARSCGAAGRLAGQWPAGMGSP